MSGWPCTHEKDEKTSSSTYISSLLSKGFFLFFFFFELRHLWDIFFIAVLLQLPQFSPFAAPCSTYPSAQAPTVNAHPVVHVHGPFTLVPYLGPSPSFFPYPLWSLSVCSLFPCLWLYFACLFCLLGSTYR